MPNIQEVLATAMAQFKMPYAPSEVVSIELCPVASGSKTGGGDTWCEVVPPDECHFYGVYAHYKNGEAHIIKDLARPEDIAMLFSLIHLLGV